MDVFSIAAGAALVGVGYFLYLVATKGLPAAVAWAKAKWNAGKADVAALQARIDTLEQGAVAELKQGLGMVRSDVDTLKAAIAPPAPAAPIVPAAAPGAAV